jgi:hypothetical protein
MSCVCVDRCFRKPNPVASYRTQPHLRRYSDLGAEESTLELLWILRTASHAPNLFHGSRAGFFFCGDGQRCACHACAGKRAGFVRFSVNPQIGRACADSDPVTSDSSTSYSPCVCAFIPLSGCLHFQTLGQPRRFPQAADQRQRPRGCPRASSAGAPCCCDSEPDSKARGPAGSHDH